MILVLSEDASADAHATLSALTRRMLRLIVPGYCEKSVIFSPLSSVDANALHAVHGNRWDSKDAAGRRWRIELMKTLASRILAGSFILYHIDGDRAWADRQSSEKPAKFDLFLEEIVRNFADERKPGREAQAIRAAFAERLRLLTPFYCIEAWLYQNTERALALCTERYRGASRHCFEQWARDRSQLDEVSQPKDKVVLAAKHNRDLAEREFPAKSVYAVGKSFTAAVEALRGCSQLLKALESPAAPGA